MKNKFIPWKLTDHLNQGLNVLNKIVTFVNTYNSKYAEFLKKHFSEILNKDYLNTNTGLSFDIFKSDNLIKNTNFFNLGNFYNIKNKLKDIICVYIVFEKKGSIFVPLQVGSALNAIGRFINHLKSINSKTKLNKLLFHSHIAKTGLSNFYVLVIPFPNFISLFKCKFPTHTQDELAIVTYISQQIIRILEQALSTNLNPKFYTFKTITLWHINWYPGKQLNKGHKCEWTFSNGQKGYSSNMLEASRQLKVSVITLKKIANLKNPIWYNTPVGKISFVIPEIPIREGSKAKFTHNYLRNMDWDNYVKNTLIQNTNPANTTTSSNIVFPISSSTINSNIPKKVEFQNKKVYGVSGSDITKPLYGPYDSVKDAAIGLGLNPNSGGIRVKVNKNKPVKRLPDGLEIFLVRVNENPSSKSKGAVVVVNLINNETFHYTSIYNCCKNFKFENGKSLGYSTIEKYLDSGTSHLNVMIYSAENYNKLNNQ